MIIRQLIGYFMSFRAKRATGCLDGEPNYYVLGKPTPFMIRPHLTLPETMNMPDILKKYSGD